MHKAHFDTRSEWLRPHLGWAIVGAVAGWFFGLWIGNVIAGNSVVVQNTRAQQRRRRARVCPSGSSAGSSASGRSLSRRSS